jgi:hypothetical protein
MRWKIWIFCAVQCLGFLLTRNWGALDPTDANVLGAVLLLPGFLIVGALRFWAEMLPVSAAVLTLVVPLVCANALAWYLMFRVSREMQKWLRR